MTYSRVVLVNGARQAGKSTLVGQLAGEHDMEWVTLDEPLVRHEAHADEMGFVQRADRMAIDEIQRMPELLLPIKAVVDRDYIPGQFLLTGSARVLGLKKLPDTLVGRMETIELWPLSQGEMQSTPDAFVHAAFQDGAELRHTSDLETSDYAERLVRGGFPGAVPLGEKIRGRFLRNYVSDLINRDVTQVSEIERSAEMRKLVDVLAAQNGGQIVPGRLAGKLGMAQRTVQRYLRLLEEVYLVKRIPAWSRNVTTRSTATAKLAFVDSGIAAALLRQDERTLRRIGSPIGGLLESFVAMEIARQLSWGDGDVELSHYRTRDNVEVDLVLENHHGQIVAIEVKASQTPRSEDFRGLRHLQERLGTDFLAGYVMYTGQRTVSFDHKLKAVPISALWEVEPR